MNNALALGIMFAGMLLSAFVAFRWVRNVGSKAIRVVMFLTGTLVTVTAVGVYELEEGDKRDRRFTMQLAEVTVQLARDRCEATNRFREDAVQDREDQIADFQDELDRRGETPALDLTHLPGYDDADPPVQRIFTAIQEIINQSAEGQENFLQQQIDRAQADLDSYEEDFPIYDCSLITTENLASITFEEDFRPQPHGPITEPESSAPSTTG